MEPERILDYWFGPLDKRDPPTLEGMQACLQLWFGESSATDGHVRAAFAAELREAAEPSLHAWEHTSRGSLALVILRDQFSRNAYRGTPRAFALDASALEVAERGIARGLDLTLSAPERVIFYLPIMHAEDRAMQARSLELYLALCAGVPAHLKPAFALVEDAARKHHAIVERFGRYPHRNRALGRPSTAEEEAFLADPASSYQPKRG